MKMKIPQLSGKPKRGGERKRENAGINGEVPLFLCPQIICFDVYSRAFLSHDKR